MVVGWFHFLYRSRVAEPQGEIYYLKPAEKKVTVIEELSITPKWLAVLYIYAHPTAHLKEGEYFFPKGATLAAIFHQITTGSGLYYRAFTIVPGWTFAEVRANLNQNPMLHHLTRNWSDAMIMQQLGSPISQAEGLFFPETYRYTRGVTDLVILKQAYALMQFQLNQAWQMRAANLPYQNPYEALITASLIEREGYLDKERPEISGVIINRLNKHMRLQIDASVIYGLGSAYTGTLHKADLTDPSVYNTYLHSGLPPTPIAMPGMPSILAALHPEMSNNYYYVAKGDGSHVFSETLEQQEAAIKTYEHHVPSSNKSK